MMRRDQAWAREKSFGGKGESSCKGLRQERAWPMKGNIQKVIAVRVQHGRVYSQRGRDLQPAECDGGGGLR